MNTEKGRRMTAALFAVLLSFTMIPTIVFANPAVPAEIVVGAPLEAAPTDGYVPGTILTIPVSLVSNPGFSSFAFSFSYDPNVFEYVSGSASYSGAIVDNADWEMIAPVDETSATGRVGFSAYYYPGIMQVSDCVDTGLLFSIKLKIKSNISVSSSMLATSLYGGFAENFADMSLSAVEVNFTNSWVPIDTSGGGGEPEITTITVGDAGLFYPGETVVLPVSVENNPGFGGAMFAINYDDTQLTLVGIEKSSDIPASVIFVSDIDTPCAMFLAFSPVNEDMKLFDLTFIVKAGATAGTTYVSVSLLNDTPLSFVDFNTIPINVEFITGSVEIDDSLDLVLPDDLNLPAYDDGATWTRIYNGNPQVVNISLQVGGGTGVITVRYDGITTAPTNVGSYTVTVTVSGATGYKDLTTPYVVGTLRIAKAPAPTISWPIASNITYGDNYGNIVLSGGSTELGSFALDSSVVLTTTPDAGTYNLPVVFTPSAATLANYQTIPVLTNNIQLIVDKASAPVVAAWPTASTIRQGQTLAASSLSFDSNTYGSFAWGDPTFAPVVPGGSYKVVFTPSASTLNNYQPIAITEMNVAVRVLLPGDIDGDGMLTAADALRILQHSAGLYTLTGDALIAADIDGDGAITAADAVRAARIAAGLNP